MAAEHIPPGVHRRHRIEYHYELLTCGLRGHVLIGADAAELRPDDAVFAREVGDTRWLRCLRCDSWLPLPRPVDPTRRFAPDRDEIELPLRGKALRDRFVLRLIAIDRVVHFVILAALAAAIFLFIRHQTQLRDTFYKVVADLQGGVGGPSNSHSGLVRDLDRLFSLQSGRLHLVGAVVIAYALVEGLEAIGLWLGRRWAEYLTFIATSVLLPLEIYEIATRQSVLKILTFAINLAVVVYLIYAKRLFGVRGGAAAEEAERARESGWEALERTSPPGGLDAAPGRVPAPANL
jgi:uncharacterized membrane protein (DUF2068 family)